MSEEEDDGPQGRGKERKSAGGLWVRSSFIGAPTAYRLPPRQQGGLLLTPHFLDALS